MWNRSSMRNNPACWWLVALYLLLSGCASVTTVEKMPTIEHSHSLVLLGQFQQGGMVVGQVPPGSKVLLNGSQLKVSGNGDFVLGFDRDTPPGDKLSVLFPDGVVRQQEFAVAPRNYDIQYVNGIDQKIQSKEKSKETLQRIEKETLAVKAARAAHYEQLFFKEGFHWPLLGPITGVFGSQRVYNGDPGRPHYGVDIAAPVGTVVFAPAGGTVTLAESDLYYSGGTVIIDHGYGVSSSFLHLDSALVHVGDVVQQGDPIGKVGNGGRSSGPHLDWRMNWYERRLDPALLVPPMNFVETVRETP